MKNVNIRFYLFFTLDSFYALCSTVSNALFGYIVRTSSSGCGALVSSVATAWTGILVATDGRHVLLEQGIALVQTIEYSVTHYNIANIYY